MTRGRVAAYIVAGAICIASAGCGSTSQSESMGSRQLGRAVAAGPTASTAPVATEVAAPLDTITTTVALAQPPVTEAPVTEPPPTDPPITEAPVTEPPPTEPPVTQPPATEPPATEPPPTDPPVTEPPRTEPPPAPPIIRPLAALPADDCNPNYSGCVPNASDVDCAGGSGNGPAYVRGPVQVIGIDVYGLDGNDNDGVGCE